MNTLNTPWKKFERVKPKSRNLRPDKCDLCRGLMKCDGGLTLFHGKWLCDVCQDNVRKGKL